MAIDAVSMISTNYAEGTKVTQKSEAITNQVQNINESSTKSAAASESNGLSKKSYVADFSIEQEKNNNENVDEKRVDNAIKEANEKLKEAGTRWEFAYQSKARKATLELIDIDTKEVIRQIPSEETLLMLEKLRSMTGILIDEQR